MKIEIAYPPNIEEIKKKFAVPYNAVFTYGDTLYSPRKEGFIDAYLMTHEETHMRQHGDNPEGWWKRYLEDNAFRLEQEVEAYKNQYNHFCRNKKNEFRQKEFLGWLAHDLSGPMYGNLCTLEEAKQHICQK